MEVKELINRLHPLERRVLPFIAANKTLRDLVEKTQLQEVEVMRALQWLANKKVVKLDAEEKQIVSLDANGLLYVKKGLPERRFLIAIKSGPKTLDEIKKFAHLEPDEIGVALGLLRGKAAIIVDKIISLTENGKKLLDKDTLEEIFLKKLSKQNADVSLLTPEEKFAFDSLKKRKEIIKISSQRAMAVELTDIGKKLSHEKIETDLIDQLTPQVISSDAWKNKKFRAYDITTEVPRIFGGRKQEYRKFLDDVREKFISLGFEEMTGPIVESEFWNMDALFMPQFHSARDIHGVYYVKEPKFAKLDDKIVAKIKQAHEKGVAGSRGWGYLFDVNKTKRSVLRTQGTACSARKLASDDLKIPGKYFGITRCFRPDVVDATHNADFYQTEGIVIEENLNIRHLFGLLKLFAKEFIGTEEIKIVPGYFPFTEPSCELYAKHPKLGWIELGGAGIFRPEVVVPLVGKRVSVLAWGLGIDRIAMFKLGIKDIRQLFSQDLDFLRSVKVS